METQRVERDESRSTGSLRLNTLVMMEESVSCVRIISTKIPSGCPPSLAQRLKAVTASLVIQLAIGAVFGAASIAHSGADGGG